jgi:hypothetical protein
MTQDEPRRRAETPHDFKIYMPGMPTVSSEPGRFERALARMFRRRGSIRPVVRGPETDA